MSYPELPLSYCTNVHPGRTLAEVLEGLNTYSAPLAQRCGGSIAAGLWLAAPVIREVLEFPENFERLQSTLEAAGLRCYTLNAFPYGDFHSPRVKENVYLPDWTERSRIDYTVGCARVLAQLLPEGDSGSISTLPLGFKQFVHPEGHRRTCIKRLLEVGQRLSQIRSETGRTIRLAIEPEPYCLLETTQEVIEFFDELFHVAKKSNQREDAERFIGLCYDVCHQAVEFEDIPQSIELLRKARIRINKVHITCALELLNPGTNLEGRNALAYFAEPRYLHQTMARSGSGQILRTVDLTPEFVLNPPSDFLEAAAWRIHFHVPVNAEHIGALQTTRPDLRRALAAIKNLPYAPHLEVETYTWPVLPGQTPEASTASSAQKSDHVLVEGLAHELIATQQLLAAGS